MAGPPSASRCSVKFTHEKAGRTNFYSYVLWNDTDPNQDPLTAVLVDKPAHGNLVLKSDGSFKYTPDRNFAGVDSFTYRASDGVGLSNFAKVTLNVLPFDDPPQALGDSYTTSEGTPLTVSLPGVLNNDSDVDSSLKSPVLVKGPAHGDLAWNSDGSFTYTPHGDFSGADSFTYGVRDRAVTSGVIYAVAVDPIYDSAARLYAISPPATTATLVATLDATFKYTNPAGLQYLPDGRLFALSSYNLVELNPVTGAALVVDDDSRPGLGGSGLALNPLNGKLYGLGDQNTLITIDPATGTRTVVANSAISDLAINSLTFTNDGTLYGLAMGPYFGQADQLVKINVATGAVTTIGPTGTDGSRNIAGLTYDPTADKLYMVATTVDADLYTLDRTTGQATKIGALRPPGAGPNESIGWVSGLAIPGLGPQSIATVTVNVTNINDAPVPVGDAYALAEDSTFTIAASQGLLTNDTDADGDSLKSVLVSGPANGTLSLNDDGGFVYAPVKDFNGTDSFTYRASDGTIASDVATVVLAVVPVNDAPRFTIGPDRSVTDEARGQFMPGGATNITPGPDDEAVQALSFSLLADHPELFAIQPSLDDAGQLRFAPNPNVSGSSLVTVILGDSGGQVDGGQDTSPPQTFRITITKPHLWRNTSNHFDTDANGEVAPLDALVIINYLNAGNPTDIRSTNLGAGPGFLDVDGDDQVAPLDALLVINGLNSDAIGEGESTGAQLVIDTGDSSAFESLISILANNAYQEELSKRRRGP